MMLRFREVCWLWLSAALLAVGGCGSGSDLAPVSGTVTYKDQPVAGATVVFMGDGNTRPATAITGADGSYSLMTLDSAGVSPGTYSVVVTKTDAPLEKGEPPSMEEAAKTANRPPPPPKDLLPAKYGDVSKTPLKFDIKPGNNRCDLPLTD